MTQHQRQKYSVRPTAEFALACVCYVYVCMCVCRQDHRVEDYVASPVCPVMVVSYEMVLRTASLLQKLDFGLLICDEGHRLKNTHIKTTSALHTLSCSRRIILTGG